MKLSSEGFNYCYQCPYGSYSLKINEKCKKCPNEYICYKNIIKIPPGVWRSNQFTDEYEKCDVIRQSCLGDLNKNYTLQNESVFIYN